ncbi:uncharacterized protein LOC105174973 isoform X2 [Sesamum indicum]|uniref:Uncharacterized protein LOC105174973 isoform X2 n=1 Tax=Sesamum indicum TaxID=4182 RepID=A0A6I9UCD0_SESIN|nr:uncharacterized protein LOC105174973 isoform X2 [Sesamum indicum]
MGCSNVPIPVFVETNLGTRLAVPVSPDITVKELKRELERAHLSCFPEFGSISVNALMVQRESHCYHLSESLPLKFAFLGSNGTWFLQMDVLSLSIPDQIAIDSVERGGFMMCIDKKRTKCKRKKVKIQRFPYLKAAVLRVPAVVCLLKRKTKRKNVKRKHKVGCQGQGPIQQPLIEKERLGQFASIAELNWSKKCDSDVIAEALSDTFSESASVSGIIKKYFSDYDEVASSSGFPFTTVRNRHKERLNNRADCKSLNIRSGMMSPVTCHIPPRASQDVWLEKPSSEASREKLREPEVGKRLLLASDSLGLTPSNQRPALSLFRFTVSFSEAVINTVLSRFRL